MKLRESTVRTDLIISCLALFVCLAAGPLTAQEVLPFPEPPMGGEVGPTMQQSVHKWRQQPRHLPEDAPNILIVMFDDAGFGQPDTFDVGMDTSSPVANDYFDRAPFAFEGTLKKLHFTYLPVGQPAFVGSPDDD